MTKTNSVPQNQPVSIAKSMLIGGTIGLLLISIFVFGVDHPRPEWGKLWQIKPLVVTPVATALGGAFYAFMDYLSYQGLNKTFSVILSIIVFIISLWLGTVLGLNGTMWN